MSEVERYDWDEEGMLSEFSGYKDIEGHWVKASDYDALAAQRDEGLAREAEMLCEVEHLRERSGSHKSLCAKHAELLKDRQALQQRLAGAEKIAARPRRMNDQRDDAYDNGWNNCREEFLAALASSGCPDGEKAFSKERFECIGKGGSYEVVGPAIGAGTLKEYEYLFVYRNKDDMHFVRTHEDFWNRMKPLSDRGDKL